MGWWIACTSNGKLDYKGGLIEWVPPMEKEYVDSHRQLERDLTAANNRIEELEGALREIVSMNNMPNDDNEIASCHDESMYRRKVAEHVLTTPPRKPS